MKKYLVLSVFFTAIALSSCSSYVKYSYKLCEIEYDGKKDFKVQEIIVSSKVDDEPRNVSEKTNVYYYSNTLFDTYWTIAERGFIFVLENKTKAPIIIAKEQICYVNIEGYTEGIVEDIQFSSDIIIPGGAKYKGVIKPKSRAHNDIPLIPTYVNDYDTTKKYIEENIIGKNLSVMMPIKTNNKDCIYTFIFKVTGAEIPTL